MRVPFFFFAFLLNIICFSGGFKWPNVTYDHASLYLMNVPFQEPPNLDLHVYKDGVYAKTKIGNGYPLSDEFLDKFHSLLARGVDVLVAGLSECFIPRHGIIYYDKVGNPVASFTACFECDGIRFWSSSEMPHFRTEFGETELKTAEKQIIGMEDLFKKYRLPVYDNEELYLSYLDSAKDYSNEGEMFMESVGRDSSFNHYIGLKEVLDWIHPSFQERRAFKETEITRVTADGDEYTFKQLSDKFGTRFLYSFDENPYITEAVIVSNGVILPNGVRVGMSLDDVLITFPVYDGIAWPKRIQLKTTNYIIDYYFEMQTLTKIEMKLK